MSNRPLIISIEGNIGTGKSTILANLQKYVNTTGYEDQVLFLTEPVDIWESIKDEQGNTVLEKFYKDQRRYAFTFQVMAYISRLTMLKRAIKNNPDKKIIVIERSLIADKNIFVNMLHDDGMIDKMEYDIYNRWYTEFIDEYKVDCIIYMDSNPNVCAARINKRHRNGEEGIPLSYLQKCRDYHTRWLIDTMLDTPVRINEFCTSYTIDHENYNYSVLHVDCNMDANYMRSDDIGNKWIITIWSFVMTNGGKELLLIE